MGKVIVNILPWVLAVWLFSGCDPGGNKEMAVVTPDSNGIQKDSLPASRPAKVKNIVFFGNSLTAGLGVDSAASFPSRIQGKIDSLKLAYRVINAGLPGETTAGGDGRVETILSQPFTIFVLELGANDGLQGIPVPEIKSNLQSIIDKVKKKYPACKIILAGMQLPPDLGETYTSDFKAIFPALATDNSIYLIPFLLQGVAEVPQLNQADGMHPNAQGEIIVAENVWEVLQPIL